jgi:tetrapyrrole methylase family protein/MazG family protein
VLDRRLFMNKPPAKPTPPPGTELADLVELVRQLRGPDGCPWDREQTLASVRAYLLEEVHEAAAAIDDGAGDRLAGELGDLLFMATLTAEIAREAGGPSLPEIVRLAIRKLVSRHPHVYGDERRTDSDEVHRTWEHRKQQSRSALGESLLGGVPDTLPALTAAYRLGQKASGVGFDWNEAAEVVRKLDEERRELDAAMARTPQPVPGELAEEMGDILFTLASISRHLGIDPEAALAAANSKFRQRFAVMEALCLERHVDLADCATEELELLWQEAKRTLRRAREMPRDRDA